MPVVLECTVWEQEDEMAAELLGCAGVQIQHVLCRALQTVHLLQLHTHILMLKERRHCYNLASGRCLVWYSLWHIVPYFSHSTVSCTKVPAELFFFNAYSVFWPESVTPPSSGHPGVHWRQRQTPGQSTACRRRPPESPHSSASVSVCVSYKGIFDHTGLCKCLVIQEECPENVYSLRIYL